jgi:hypothetical protein
MDRARTVVRDWDETRLTLVEAQKLEELLDREDAVNPELLAMIAKGEARRIGPRTYRLPAR